MTFKVRKLAKDDDRALFRSGNPDLDRFFARYAGQNQFRHHIGTTYVAVNDTEQIVGFATVAASELAPEVAVVASSRLRHPYPVPVLRLARMAVDVTHARLGVGGALLRAVFAIAEQMANDVGCVGVVVDAKPDAVGFYEKLGFVPLQLVAGALGDRPQTTPMFIELQQTR